MNRAFNWIGQALLYSCFALAIGVFSRWPVYHPLEPEHALIKVSFVHHGVRVADCRPYTKEELAKLAPNMRAPMKCERERSPVQIELDIDGKTVYQKTAYPSGLSRDGASTVYQSFDVPAGARRITIALRRTGDARPRHDGHVRRFLVVLRALLGPARCGEAVRP